jgi:hypothetical protein
MAYPSFFIKHVDSFLFLFCDELRILYVSSLSETTDNEGSNKGKASHIYESSQIHNPHVKCLRITDCKRFSRRKHR